jgi:hypothetical protein
MSPQNESPQEIIEASATPWPLDFTKLQKGQTITTKELESITGIPSTHPNYNFALMTLRQDIMTQTERMGKPLSVRIHQLSLVINTDAEASLYHAKLGREAERCVFRNAHYLKNTVDVANLTNEERAEHDRRLLVAGVKTAALRGAKDHIHALPAPKSTASSEATAEAAGEG